jgi:DNA-binding beta-propeller fold protein YncE
MSKTPLVIVAGAALLWVIGSPLVAHSPQSRSLPIFEVDSAWPQVPEKWKLGDPSSFAIDTQDNVWLLHRPRTLPPDRAAMAAPPVMVFDSSGRFIRAWGGAGSGYEWPEREHGIHVDAKGFVWLGGNNCPTNGVRGVKPVADDQLLKLTPDGRLVMQIGRSNQSKGNADTRNLHRPADVWVHAPTNELFVADGYGNHRIIVLDATTGAFKRMWGAFGEPPVDDDHCEVVTPKTVEDPGPRSFSIVHALRVARDGTVYVADRENRRIQSFTADGRFLKQLVKTGTAFARNVALSPDREQQFLYVGNGDDIAVVDRKTLTLVGSIKPAGLKNAGHQIATDSKGNLYLAQTASGMQKLTFRGMSPARN